MKAHPIDSLAELVDAIPELDPEEARGRWVEFIRSADKAQLAAKLPTALDLLSQVREMGSGWPTRARALTEVLKTHRKAEAPKKRPPPVGADPEVVAMLKGGPFGPHKSTLNCTTILTHDRRWAGKVRLNEFDQDIYVDGERLADADLIDIANDVDRCYDLPNVKPMVADALVSVARQHAYHPVRDYLRGLRWDGRRRIEGMLTTYMGAAPGLANDAMAYRWMISAVARIMAPPVKVDTMLILAGKQGAGKSTFAAILGGEWFSDAEVDPHNIKDAVLNLQGVWIMEVGEVDKWKGREQSTVKAFITRENDKIRKPYGRYPEHFPRQSVFIGTTNADDFLTDSTGARRYWPVQVGRLDAEGLRRDRDQLWAEAVRMFNDGEQWHLDENERKAASEAASHFTRSDPWEAAVKDAVGLRREVTVAEVMKEMGLAVERQDYGAANRVGDVLRGMGWSKKRVSTSVGWSTVWRPEGS